MKTLKPGMRDHKVKTINNIRENSISILHDLNWQPKVIKLIVEPEKGNHEWIYS